MAVAALPLLYFLVNSSFTLSKKAIGVCLPAASTATTQYATQQKRKYINNVKTNKKNVKQENQPSDHPSIQESAIKKNNETYNLCESWKVKMKGIF